MREQRRIERARRLRAGGGRAAIKIEPARPLRGGEKIGGESEIARRQSSLRARAVGAPLLHKIDERFDSPFRRQRKLRRLREVKIRAAREMAAEFASGFVMRERRERRDRTTAEIGEGVRRRLRRRAVLGLQPLRRLRRARQRGGDKPASARHRRREITPPRRDKQQAFIRRRVLERFQKRVGRARRRPMRVDDHRHSHRRRGRSQFAKRRHSPRLLDFDGAIFFRPHAQKIGMIFERNFGFAAVAAQHFFGQRERENIRARAVGGGDQADLRRLVESGDGIDLPRQRLRHFRPDRDSESGASKERISRAISSRGRSPSTIAAAGLRRAKSRNAARTRA